MSENSDNEVFSPYVDDTPISGTPTKSSTKSSTKKTSTKKSSSKKKKMEVPLDFNDEILVPSTIEKPKDKSGYFFSFMEKYKAIDGGEYTHSLLASPYGNYRIPNSELQTFYRFYRKACNERMALKIEPLSVAEKHYTFGPVVLDFIFKSANKNLKRIYNDHVIKNVINVFLHQLTKYIEIPYEKRISFILETKSPSIISGKAHDSFRVIFTEFGVKPNILYVVRDECIKEMSQTQIFEDLELTNDIDNIFSSETIDGLITLYGSAKPYTEPYVVTKIFDYEQCKIPIIMYDEHKLPEELSIRKFQTDYLEESIAPYQADVNLVELENKYHDIKTNLSKTKELNRPIGSTFIKRALTPEDYQTAVDLSDMLSHKRAQNKITWIQVGWALHDIDYGLLPQWVKFSKYCPERIDSCEELWVKMKERGYYLASLHWWSIQDNKEKYDAYKLDKINEALKKTVQMKGTPYRIAKVLLLMNDFKYVCSSLKHKQWFEYKNHRWEIVEEGYTLLNFISTNLSIEFKKLSDIYYGVAIQITDDQDKKDEYMRKVKCISDIIQKLEKTKDKNDIMAEARLLFYNSKFLERLDENRHLLGCKNGVYDLEHLYFREGCPDDYIHLSTGIDYYEYDNRDTNIKQVVKFIQQLQPEQDNYTYLIKLISSYLQGNIPDEKFHIWTGSGANGKSKLLYLIQKTFGDYCGTFSIALLTKKRGASSGPSPEIADKKGIRFGAFQEPEKDDTINVGLMKELTGGDRILARGLYKDPVYFNPQFKLLLACNDLPDIPSNDGGTWRRLRVLLFGSKFVENPKAPNEYKIDPHLVDKLDNLREAFLSLLVHYFGIYKKEGLSEPETVIQYTKEYQAKSDIYMSFINEHLVKTDKEDDQISLIALYSIFKSWYKEAYSDHKIPTKKDLKEYLVKNTDISKLLVKDTIKKYKIASTIGEEDDESNKVLSSIKNI